MTLIYSLDQNDFLQHQLYIASKSARIKKKRRNSWLLVTIAFFVLGLVFYDMANKLMMYYFFGASLISFIFYPFYLKYHYKKHYQKFINDTYKNRTAEPSTICFKEQQVELFDKTAESKINFTEFEEIVEKTQERLYDADFIESMELSFKEVMGDKISMRKFSI